MTDKHHNLITGEQLHIPFNGGLDSARPVSPAIGDWWFSTDTEKLYYCATIGIWKEFTPASTTSANYGWSTTFTSADLVAGILTLTHTLNSETLSVTIKKADGKLVEANDVDIVDANTVSVDLLGIPLTGTWTAILISAGGPSVSSFAFSITGGVGTNCYVSGSNILVTHNLSISSPLVSVVDQNTTPPTAAIPSDVIVTSANALTVDMDAYAIGAGIWSGRVI